HSTIVALAAGQNGHVAIVFDSEGVTLLLSPQPPEGANVLAQVYAVQGTVAGATGKALRAAVAASSASYTFVGIAASQRPARATGVKPGAYTLCAIPFPNGAGFGPPGAGGAGTASGATGGSTGGATGGTAGAGRGPGAGLAALDSLPAFCIA